MDGRAPKRRRRDTIRLYLSQIGDVPLLTREQEGALSRFITITRTRFHRVVLRSPAVIERLVAKLQAYTNGELPFEQLLLPRSTEGIYRADPHPSRASRSEPHGAKFLAHGPTARSH